MRVNQKTIDGLLGGFDATAAPPPIAPVPGDRERPLWSVMIPTFNCAEYLRETLESVLAQDPGPDRMHIEVVDDCSTEDDPEAVVAELGAGRVIFTRNAENTGCCTLNFNHCLRRSIGHWVHVLHGDDRVLPGFYDHIEGMMERHPEVSLLATRSVFVDGGGCWLSLERPIKALAGGGNDTSEFHFRSAVQFAGVALRRSFVEEHGGFREDLVHTADWEMWERVIGDAGGAVSDAVFGVYRLFAANHTGRLMRTGGNLEDRLRLIEILAARRPQFPKNAAIRKLIRVGQDQARKFRKLGDEEAVAANRRFTRRLGGLAGEIEGALRDIKKTMLGV